MSREEATKGYQYALCLGIVGIVALTVLGLAAIVTRPQPDVVKTLLFTTVGTIAGAGAGAAIVYRRAKAVLNGRQKARDHARRDETEAR